MFKITRLFFENVFSYGEIELVFDKNIVQIIGENGAGKSSIALALEIGLYGKNSKKIKAADILNRDKKSYTIEVDFIKNGCDYTVVNKRTKAGKNTIVVLADGEDISGHTATQSYKQLEEIIGLSHDQFSGLVNQTLTSGIDFIYATPASRINFLTKLLDLSQYEEKLSEIKIAGAELENRVSYEKGKVTATNTSLRNLNIPDLVEEDEDVGQVIALVKSSNLQLLEEKNKRIEANNTWIRSREKIIEDLREKRPEVYSHSLIEVDNTLVPSLTTRIKELREQIRYKSYKIDNLESSIISLKANISKRICGECNQEVPVEKYKQMVATKSEEVDKLTINKNDLTERLNMLEVELAAVEKDISINKKIQSKIDNSISRVETFERKMKALRERLEEVEGHIDNELPTELYDITDEKTALERENREILAHNAIVDKKQRALAEAKANNKLRTLRLKEKTELEDKLHDQEIVLATLQEELRMNNILYNAFSKKGIVSYKIEIAIKSLEDYINKYLHDLSEFHVEFVMKDKLNVFIHYLDTVVDPVNLSSGERARLDISVLLGIREFQEALSSVHCNLLFLDETVSALDTKGMDDLINVLRDTNLNTFIVSHNYSNPMVDKLHIYKENGVSKYENV